VLKLFLEVERSSVFRQKQIIRERIITLLRNQEEEKRSAKSLVILNRLLKMQEFQNAVTVLFYYAFLGEVETIEMIKRAQQLGKRIGLPKIIKEKNIMYSTLAEDLNAGLEDGPYGIKQTKESKVLSFKDIDMIIVPGIAFDKNNNRLGRGGGYYDRFLKDIPANIPTVGLAFDFQIVDNLPTDKHDVPVHHVLTD